MTYLVTGGAGFIGSHVCDRLLAQGERVVVLDELNDFYSPELKEANLESVGRRGPFTLHRRDICDEQAVDAIFADHRPDVVIHLAARAGVRPSLEQPLLYERVNVRGTMVLLEAARRHKVKKFVFASSSSVYGIANSVPFREDDRDLRPVSPYAATKIAGEALCQCYANLYRLPVAALRFFTVYGPRQRPDLAIRKFTQMISDGRRIPVYGDGSTGRDYTFVEDIVDGIMAAAGHDELFEVFNLGNSHPVTLRQMISSIEQALGKSALIDWLPDQPGDVPITYANISKANNRLGYEPRTRFQEGILRFVEWFTATHPPALPAPESDVNLWEQRQKNGKAAAKGQTIGLR